MLTDCKSEDLDYLFLQLPACTVLHFIQATVKYWWERQKKTSHQEKKFEHRYLTQRSCFCAHPLQLWQLTWHMPQAHVPFANQNVLN